MSGLTSKQRSIFEYLRRHIRDRGYPPTIREIRDAFGLKSNRGIIDHLKALERKGYIKRAPGSSRAIEIMKNVEFEHTLFDGRGDIVLEVKGDSMTGDHILSGDLIIVQKTDRYESGILVVVDVGGEATVKRYFRKGGRIVLQPGNPAYEPIELPDGEASSCRIIGRVVGVIRSLGSHPDGFSG